MDKVSSENASTTAYDLGDFNKFPAEIRNEIYRYALTAPSTITIKRREDRPAGSSQPSKYLKLCGSIIIMKGRQKRRVACRRGTGIGLLQVSKALHTESAAIFYHSNNFIFQHPAALSNLVSQINEMAFYLADVEIKGVSGSRTLHFSYILEHFRICSKPRRIAYRVPNTSLDNAAILASSTWRQIKAFVKRERGHIYFEPGLVGLRSHMHTDMDGTNPKYTYRPLTDDAQMKRLEAFCFDVPRRTMFLKPGTNGYVMIRDQAKRARVFKKLVDICWCKDLLEEQEPEESQQASKQDGVSESESEDEVEF